MNRPSGVVGGIGSPRAPWLYRLLRLGFSVVARALLRVRVSGLENLPRGADGRPAGGWIAAGLPHRTWVEPLLLFVLLPAEPRLVVLGDGPTMYRSWWRRLLARRVGGLVPVWRGSGGDAFEGHVAAARAALRAGCVFAIFPEIGGPSRPPALRRVSPGIGYIALRTGAPVVPVVFGGTDDLFLGRRIDVRVLPSLEPMRARSERDAAHALTAALIEAVVPVAAELHTAAEPPPGARKSWRWLRGPFPRAE